jgi:sec-independent protein translocase protein TatA
MGIGGISWPQILVVLVIVLLIFGTKRIRNIGSDLGGAIREFRKGVGESDDDSDDGDRARGRSGSDDSNKGSSSSRDG